MNLCIYQYRHTHIYSHEKIENKVVNERKLTPWRRTSNAVRNVGQLVLGRMWVQLVLLGRRRVSSTSTSCHCFSLSSPACFLLFSHSSNSNAYKTVTKPKTLLFKTFVNKTQNPNFSKEYIYFQEFVTKTQKSLTHRKLFLG